MLTRAPKDILQRLLPMCRITVEVTPGEFRDLKSSEVYSFRSTTGGAGEATMLDLTAACHRWPAYYALQLSLPWLLRDCRAEVICINFHPVLCSGQAALFRA